MTSTERASCICCLWAAHLHVCDWHEALHLINQYQAGQGARVEEDRGKPLLALLQL